MPSKITSDKDQIIAGMQAVCSKMIEHPHPRADPFQTCCLRAADGQAGIYRARLDVTSPVPSRPSGKGRGPPPCRVLIKKLFGIVRELTGGE